MIVEDIKKELGSDAELVTVEAVGNVAKVALKEYQRDREIWRRINENLKALGGKWNSAGKDSHWSVPLTARTEFSSKQILLKELDEIQAHLNTVRRGLEAS